MEYMTHAQIKSKLTRNGIKTIELDNKCIVVTIDLDLGWGEKMEWFERFITLYGGFDLKAFAHKISDDRVCIAYYKV